MKGARRSSGPRSSCARRARRSSAAAEQDAERNAHLRATARLANLMEDNASLEADRDTLHDEPQARALFHGGASTRNGETVAGAAD